MKKLLLLALLTAGLSSCTGRINGDTHVITKSYSDVSTGAYKHCYEIDNWDYLYTDSLYKVGDVLKIKR